MCGSASHSHIHSMPGCNTCTLWHTEWPHKCRTFQPHGAALLNVGWELLATGLVPHKQALLQAPAQPSPDLGCKDSGMGTAGQLAA